MATELERYLKDVLSSPDACRQFWKMIPEVRAGCNNSSTYEKPLAVETYAYVHLLERYRRFWDVLLHITDRGILPLGDRGINVLDIGTAPAPALYAVDDYYRLLAQFAAVSGIEELTLPNPRLECVESSQNMIYFCHRFSEYCHRPGPFSAALPDLTGVDFRSMRDQEYRQLLHKTYYDSETGEYQYEWIPTEANEFASRLFRYRLIILSNFLTLSETVDTFHKEIQSILSDLNPGSVVAIIGAYGEKYKEIYAKIEEIATDSRVRRIGWVEERLGEESWPEFSKRMKAFHFAIYQHITCFCDPKMLPRKGYPNYWDLNPSDKFRPKFGLRVFRKGR